MDDKDYLVFNVYYTDTIKHNKPNKYFIIGFYPKLLGWVFSVFIFKLRNRKYGISLFLIRDFT